MLRPWQSTSHRTDLHTLLKLQSFANHINRYANSVIMSVVYGKRCPRYETPETTALFNVLSEYVQLAERGSTPPLDVFPFLKYIPEWTMLAGWKKRMRDLRQSHRDLILGLLEETIKRMERGEENGCYMEEVILRQKELGLDHEKMAYVFSCWALGIWVLLVLTWTRGIDTLVVDSLNQALIPPLPFWHHLF